MTTIKHVRQTAKTKTTGTKTKNKNKTTGTKLVLGSWSWSRGASRLLQHSLGLGTCQTCNKSSNSQDVDVEWMYELRQSPLCPPRTYDLHFNDTYTTVITSDYRSRFRDIGLEL